MSKKQVECCRNGNNKNEEVEKEDSFKTGT